MQQTEKFGRMEIYLAHIIDVTDVMQWRINKTTLKNI